MSRPPSLMEVAPTLTPEMDHREVIIVAAPAKHWVPTIGRVYPTRSRFPPSYTASSEQELTWFSIRGSCQTRTATKRQVARCDVEVETTSTGATSVVGRRGCFIDRNWTRGCKANDEHSVGDEVVCFDTQTESRTKIGGQSQGELLESGTNVLSWPPSLIVVDPVVMP
jgi:hypothetical protein